MANDIRYEIKEEIAVLSESTKGWKKELNLVSWNGAEPKYDIRTGLLITRKWVKG